MHCRHNYVDAEAVHYLSLRIGDNDWLGMSKRGLIKEAMRVLGEELLEQYNADACTEPVPAYLSPNFTGRVLTTSSYDYQHNRYYSPTTEWVEAQGTSGIVYLTAVV